MIGTESGVDSSRVYSVGCSGVRVAGGDAHSLTPGRAYVTGNKIANFSLWKRTYMPGIFWNGAKNAFFCAILYPKRSFYQDRLGTNIGKTPKKMCFS
jgi:hypothetical protein